MIDFLTSSDILNSDSITKTEFLLPLTYSLSYICVLSVLYSGTSPLNIVVVFNVFFNQISLNFSNTALNAIIWVILTSVSIELI